MQRQFFLLHYLFVKEVEKWRKSRTADLRVL